MKMLEMLLTECGRLLHKAWGAAGAPQDEDVMPCGGTEDIGSLSPLNLNASVSRVWSDTLSTDWKDSSTLITPLGENYRLVFTQNTTVPTWTCIPGFSLHKKVFIVFTLSGVLNIWNFSIWHSLASFSCKTEPEQICH